MKVNRILMAFLLFIVISSIALWNVIQSDFVGKKISNFITESISHKLNADVSFKSLDIKLYPPGIELEEVKFKRSDEDKLDISALKLGVKFDLVQSMQRELTLEDIYIEKGKISFKSKEERNTEKKKIDISKISLKKILKKVKDKSPVKIGRISLKETEVVYNQYKTKVNKLSLSPYRNGLAVSLSAENIQPQIYDFKLSKVDAKINLEDDQIKIKEIQLKSDNKEVQLGGVIKDYRNLKAANADISYKAKGNLTYFNKFIRPLNLGSIKKGSLEVDGKLKGSIKDYKSKASFVLKDVDTPFVDSKIVNAVISLTNKEVRIEKFNLKNNEESLLLVKPFQLLNLETLTYVDEPIDVKANKIKLKNALKVLKKKLSVLDGELSGGVRFVLNKKDYHFYLKDKATLENTSLNIEENEILNIPILYSKASTFSIYKNKFEMEMDVFNINTKLKVKGEIDFNGALKFYSRNAKIDLKEIGLITGIKYEGLGLVDVDVYMDDKDAYLNIEGKYENFKLEDYSQKEVSSKLNLDFNSSVLRLSDIKSSAGRTKSEGYLNIDLNNMNVEGRVGHKNIIYEEVLASLNLENLIEGQSVDGNWSADYVLSGKLNPKEIVLKGKVRGKNNLFLDESLDSLSADISYQNEVLGFDNILVQKSKGRVTGSYNYSFLNSESNFKIYPNRIVLEELNSVAKLPLGINGKVSGEVSGIYADKLTNLFVNLKVVDTVIPGKKIGDSTVKLKLTKDVIEVDLNLLGEKIKVNSISYLDDRKFSTLEYSTRIDDINEVIGTNRFVDLENTNIKGELYTSGNAKYKIKDLQVDSATLNIEKLSLNKDMVNFSYENPQVNEIEVRDAKIKKWSFYIRGQNVYFISKAKGNLRKSFNLETDFKIDASIFEVFNKVISKASGPIYGKYRLSDLKNISKQKLRLKADELSLSTSGHPIRFEDISFQIEADEESIAVKRLSSKIGAGMFNLLGNIDISHLVPKLDFDFKFTHAGINLFEKSNLIFSGQGKLEGDSFPYSLKSDLYIERLNIVNEFADLMTGSDILADDIKYLPNSYVDSGQNLLDLEVNLKTTNPASVKNSMSDLSYLGQLDISGSELNPVAVGGIYLAPGINKIFFKGNEYNILKSNISFLKSSAISNPELDIEANSEIEDYSLKAKVTGPVKNFDLSLRTDPSLEENDILSLIAFGYTENTSSSLSEEQRSLMTQAGIGSLLFESFKINETLKKELGIQLNLGTEISNANEDYLAQKNATGTSGQSVNSATKIEVKKEISSDIDLSVSSTVGSSSEQKQRMNLNYKVSDQVSLEGIYENTTNTENATQGDDSSLGVDVRWKWTFK